MKSYFLIYKETCQNLFLEKKTTKKRIFAEEIGTLYKRYVI